MKKSLKVLFISLLLSVILTIFIKFGFQMSDISKIILTQDLPKYMNTIELLDKKYITMSNDSWFKIKNIENSNDYGYIEIDINNLSKDVIASIYYGIGDNFSEDEKIDHKLENGKNIISLHKNKSFDTLRIDIGSEKGIEFEIDSLSLVSEVSNDKFILSSFIIVFILSFIVLNLINKRKGMYE